MLQILWKIKRKMLGAQHFLNHAHFFGVNE